MLAETLIDYAVTLFSLAIDGFNMVNLPFDLINALGTVISYGSFVVGSDLLLVFSGTVAFWLSVKLSVGVILFIWRLLPGIK